MIKKLIGSKIFTLVLSFIIACLLWGYVVNVVNEEITVHIKNVSVTFEGADTLLEERNLQVVTGQTESVDLDVTGRRSEVQNLSRDNVSVTVDLGDIRNSGDYSLAYAVGLPDDIDEGSVSVSRSPYYVRVSVVKLVSTEVRLEGVFEGSTAEDYIRGEFELSPDVITVTGPESTIASIAKGVVTVNEEGLSKNIDKSMSYVLLDSLHNPIDMTGVIVDSEKVDVFVPVYKVKDVPVVARFIEGDGITEEDITYKVEPEFVTVYGFAESLEGINSFVLPTIDLTTMVANEVLSFPIPISNDVSNLSGETIAEVSVKIVGVSSKTIETKNFVIMGEPEGYYVDVVRNTLAVTVRAPRSQIDLIESNNIRVVLDLSNISAYNGNQLISAAVYVDGFADAGVVGDYTVAVTLSTEPPVEDLPSIADIESDKDTR